MFAAIVASTMWVFENLIQSAVFKNARVETEAWAWRPANNARLIRFLHEILKRGPHLARLVSSTMATDPDRSPVFGGFYLWTIARGKTIEVKFVRDFFKKVESTQGSVAWTQEAVDLNARYRLLAMLGYTALTAAADWRARVGGICDQLLS